MRRRECILAAVLLLVLALFAPLLLFYFKDSVQMNHIVVKDREGLSISSFSTTYELNLQKRLAKFVEGTHLGTECHVTQMEPGTKKEAVDLVNKALGQDPLSQIIGSDYNTMYLGPEKEFSVLDWKRYAVFSEADKDGVVFIVEYVKIETAEDLEIQLLVDAKTTDVYYLTIKMSSATDAPAKKEQFKVFSPDLYYFAYMLYDYYSGGIYFDILESDEEDKSSIDEIWTEDAVYINLLVKLKDSDLQVPVSIEFGNGSNGYVGMQAGLYNVWALFPQSAREQEAEGYLDY